MSNRSQQRGENTRSRLNMPGLGETARDGETVLIPVLPAATIDEIIGHLEAARGRSVELLVPNNTRALQSLAGCELVRNAAAERGVRLTLFTADEKTAGAAKVAKIDTVAVGGPITVPTGRKAASPPQPAVPAPRPSPSPPAKPTPVPERRSPVQDQSRRAAAPPPRMAASPPPGPAEEADFLTGLAAFERQQASRPAGAGETLSSAEGAVLFDAPGDLGVPRGSAPEQNEWAAAFDDMGDTMAAEPMSPRRARSVRQPDQAVQQAAQPRSSGGVVGALTGVLPRRQSAPVRTGDVDSARMPRRQPSPEEATPRAHRSRRVWLLPLVIVGLLAFALLGRIALRSFAVATDAPAIALTPAAPNGETQRFSGISVPVRSTAIDTATSPEVQGVLLEQPVSVTVQGRAISETLTPMSRARGVLVLRNRSTQPITVRAGSVLQAPNGVQFTIDNGVTVPAAVATPDSITFGREQATVTATVPGSVGNIAGGSITEIQGIGGTLRVEHGAFSGGEDQPISIVRVEDVNAVLPAGLSQLYGTGQQALQARIADQPTLALSQDAITPTLEMLQRLEGVAYGVFPPIGSVAPNQTFNLELRTIFRAVAEPADRPLAEQLPTAVRNQLASTQGLAGDVEVQITGWTVGPQGLLVDATSQPSGNVPPLPDAFLNEVRQQVANRPRQEAEAFLQGLVEEGQIAAFAPIPEEWTTVPEQVRIIQASP